MDREEAADKKARLAPPPTKQGWLHKKGGTALSAERKRWFVLQGAGSEATLRYSKEVNGGHRGTIRCEDIRGVVQDDNTLDIYTPDRTYHVRASSEQSAGQWATVIRCAAAGAEEVDGSAVVVRERVVANAQRRVSLSGTTIGSRGLGSAHAEGRWRARDSY